MSTGVSLVRVPQERISKEEEIAVIKEFYETLPADSYLKEILKGLPDYCEDQIRNDFCINPLESMEVKDKSYRSLEGDYKQVVLDKDKTEKDLIKQLEEFKKRASDGDRAVEDLYLLQEQYSEERCGLFNQIVAAKKENEALQLDIIRYKARLFDLIDTEKNEGEITK